MIEQFQNENRFLSNFYPSPINLYGIEWPTVEHVYQALKSLDKRVWNRVLENDDARHAKRIGKKIDIRPDWDEIKDTIMKDAVHAKFSQNSELKEKLISTGNEYLQEGNSWGDTYWGVCKGVGKNRLGEILMDVREEIQNER